MISNLTFAGKMPQKVVKTGVETLETIAKEAKYVSPYSSIEKDMLKSAENIAKEGDLMAINSKKPLNILEAEARAIKEAKAKEAIEKAIAEQAVPSVPYN